VLDKKISRVNVKRKKIFTEDKGQMDYDVLIVTETPENKYPDIKGTNKAGVYGYKKFKDVDAMMNAMAFVDCVVIQSDTWAGLEAAVAFAKREKDVILISSDNDVLGKCFEGEMLERVARRFAENGVRIMRGQSIGEVLGDKDAKAVRLQSGKVLAAQIILFVETAEDLRLFSDPGLEIDTKIQVNTWFQSKAEGVFGVDQARDSFGFEPITPLEILEEQGMVVAAAISGEELTVVDCVAQRHLHWTEINIVILGQVERGEDVAVYRACEQESGRYKGLYVKGRRLVGAVLVDRGDEVEEILTLIRDKSLIDAAFIQGGLRRDGETLPENAEKIIRETAAHELAGVEETEKHL
jgi:nitrite reductase (NADH) large subunit